MATKQPGNICVAQEEEGLIDVQTIDPKLEKYIIKYSDNHHENIRKLKALERVFFCTDYEDLKMPIFDTDTVKTEQPTQEGPTIISIECTARPAPTAIWTWERVHFRKYGARMKSYVVDLGNERYRCELRIDSYSRYDAGTYRVEARNRRGVARFSINMEADNEPVKPRILKGPYTRYLGNNLYRLEVTVWSPNNERICWQKFRGGKVVKLDLASKCQLTDDLRIKVNATERNKCILELSLEIREATRYDRGTYRCDVYDQNGTLHCDFPMFFDKGTPIGRPSLYAEPRVFQLKTQNVIMAFCIRSPAEPTYTWIFPSGVTKRADEIYPTNRKAQFHHRKLKSPDGAEELYEGKLNLTHWFTAEKGIYKCVVENIYGSLEIKFELRVTEKMMSNEVDDWRKPYIPDSNTMDIDLDSTNMEEKSDSSSENIEVGDEN